MSFAKFNVAISKMGEFSTALDKVNNAIVRAVEEAKKESLFEPEEDGPQMLALSDELVERKFALKDMSEGLKAVKEKTLQENVNEEDLEATFNTVVSERKQLRNPDDAKNDRTRMRLENLITGGANQRPAPRRTVNEGDDDSLVLDEIDSQFGHKCPITQKEIVVPYRNRHCGHVFEHDAVLQYIRDVQNTRGVNATCPCPYIGCQNKKKFGVRDLEEYSFATATQEF